ncbi:hypothetical protein QUO19_003991 [Vibrio parahaemolyticus]|nr:hypothetical protein [Vibrio parahaemolyticus]
MASGFFIYKGHMTSSNQRPHQYTYDPQSYILKVKRFHQTNYDSVDKALRHANQQLRKSIASSSDAELTNTRLYSMLLSVWCEARLHVLLYEDGAFDEVQRAVIYNSDSVELRWKKALHVAVIKNAGLDIDAEISDKNTSFSLLNIFNKINELIGEYFSSVNRNRNKIAHAQWVTPFTNLQGVWENSSSFSVCETTKTDFQTDNLLTLDLKMKLLKSIAVAINNIAVDSNNYQVQNFDDLYKTIRTHEDRISSIDFPNFKSTIQRSFQDNRA